MITRAQLQQFFTGVGMILVFIGIKKSPLDNVASWIVFVIAGVLFFTFAPSMAKRLTGEA